MDKHNQFMGNMYQDEEIIYIKTIQIYTHELKMVREILCEQVSCELNNSKRLEQDNERNYEQSHNTSTIQWKNNIYFFKRIFDPSNMQHKL